MRIDQQHIAFADGSTLFPKDMDAVAGRYQHHFKGVVHVKLVGAVLLVQRNSPERDWEVHDGRLEVLRNLLQGINSSVHEGY